MKERKSKEDSYSNNKSNVLLMKKKAQTNIFSLNVENYSQFENKNIIINTQSGNIEKNENKIPSSKECNQINEIKDVEILKKLQREYSYKKNIIKSHALKNKIKRIHNPFCFKSKGYFTITFIIFLLFHGFSYELKQRKIFYYFSDITIKLEGEGTLSVFYGGDSCSEGIFSPPDEVYINLVKQNEVTDKYDFAFPFNIIKLRWYNNFANLNCLFKDCINIIEIDFSGFYFSSRYLLAFQMFYNCTSLTSINIQPSSTAYLGKIAEMFSYCESLTSIDLSKFNLASQVTNSSGMFRGCRSLTSLDLSSFIGTLNYGQYMFDDCPNLIFVNIYGLHFCTSPRNIEHFFSTKNIVFSGGCDVYNSLVVDYVKNDYNTQNQMKLNLENGDYVRDCSYTANNRYLYLARCYDSCPNGTYTNNLKCEKCHPDCETCEGPPEPGNTNCALCKSKYKNLKSGNCMYDCTEETPFEVITYHICVKYCPIKELLDNDCILAYQSDNENKLYDIMIGNINHGFTSEQYDIEHLELGGEDVIEYGKMTVKLTTSENEKNNLNINSTTIDLKGCENILIEKNNIPEGENLFIKKIEIKQDGMKIPKIEYDIYRKIQTDNGRRLEKLDLSVCKNNRVHLSIPISLPENIDLDKLNISGKYLNDRCYPATSDSGTDITIKDRRDEFVQQNQTICQEDCFIYDYNKTVKRVECSCEAKESSSSFKDMNIDNTKLFDQFKDIKNIMNIDIVLCLNVIIPFVTFHFIVVIIFYCKQKKELFKKIENIHFGINNWHLIQEKGNLREKGKKKGKETKKKKQIQKKGTKKLNSRNKKNESLLTLKNNATIDKRKNFHKRKEANKKYKKSKSLFHMRNNNNPNNGQNKTTSNTKKIKFKKAKTNNIKNKNEIIKKVKKIMEPNLEEKNKMPYELALKNDKRTYFQYYSSLIQTKHAIAFSFIYNKDYNSKIIKIDLFFIGFVIFFTINALFFNDNTMHKIHIDKGAFDFLYQIPQIVYSFLISSILDILITFFSLSEDDILEFKNDKNKKTLNQRHKNLKKKLQIKFIFYFIISFLLLVFFWYYLAMFGVIYKNTQIHLIKDTGISYALSFVSPFGFYLIPGIFRKFSLSKKNRKCFYQISLFVQSI